MCSLPLVRLPAVHGLLPLVRLRADHVLLLAEHMLRSLKKKRSQTTRPRIRTSLSLGLRRRKMIRSQVNPLGQQRKHAELAQGTSDVLAGRTLRRATLLRARWLRREGGSKCYDLFILSVVLVNYEVFIFLSMNYEV
ncbi:hypothetical protein D1007_31829 [Hordeum vulgare]|nr:hypothetical protein D1007_31829 [Hordeum vulgare]